MNTRIENRKLRFVQNFLRVGDEELINKFEELLRKEQLRLIERELKTPLSKKAFNEIIDQAEEDNRNGRLTSAKSLRKKIRSWK
ncbi:MAG: hypothetical protein SH857_18120 [Chitinophagales bacterium]|nr:hypothetical protein [Chitinophagales bacterium]